jgi:hypothetical protein
MSSGEKKGLLVPFVEIFLRTPSITFPVNLPYAKDTGTGSKLAIIVLPKIGQVVQHLKHEGAFGEY